MSWKRTVSVGGMFSIVKDPRVQSCFLTSSTLIWVHVLLYMMMNLSSSVMISGSTFSGCEERVMRAPVSMRTNQTSFLCWICITPTYHVKHHCCLWLLSLQAVYWWACVWWKWLHTPKLIQSSSMCKTWRWPTDIMTTSESIAWITTFIIPCFVQWPTRRSIWVSTSLWVHGWRLSMTAN